MCPENAPFATSQAVAVWNAVSACWSNEVYMPVLSYRFWKLTLQVRRNMPSIFTDLTPKLSSSVGTKHGWKRIYLELNPCLRLSPLLLQRNPWVFSSVTKETTYFVSFT